MSIEITKKGEYQVRYRDENRIQRAKTFIRKRDAENFQAKIRIEIRNGTWLDPEMGKIKLSETWNDFIALKRGKKRSTQYEYESIWRLHLEPKWGNKSVQQIDRIDFDKWILGIKLSPQRIGKIHLIMSMILDHAVEAKNLRKNPLKDSIGKRHKKNLPTILTEVATEFLTLNELISVANLAGFYRDVILTLGLCGMRWGELVGLRVKDLNVNKGTLTIRRALIEFNGVLVEDSPKNYRQRIIKMPDVLVAVCASWVDGKEPEDPLFHTQRGTHLRNTNFVRRVFRPALKEAGVKTIRIHDLRHTAASIAISAGATPNMVKEMLGHSDVQTTMRIYAHIFEADRETVAANVNRAVSEVHQLCIETKNVEHSEMRSGENLGSELGFSFAVPKFPKIRTSNYEFRALTN
jgi:integrase